MNYFIEEEKDENNILSIKYSIINKVFCVKYSDNNQCIFIITKNCNIPINNNIIIIIILIFIIRINILDIIINSIGNNIITPTISSNYIIGIIPIKIIENNTINYYYIKKLLLSTPKK